MGDKINEARANIARASTVDLTAGELARAETAADLVLEAWADYEASLDGGLVERAGPAGAIAWHKAFFSALEAKASAHGVKFENMVAAKDGFVFMLEQATAERIADHVKLAPRKPQGAAS